jgi:replication initiation and membrane attachment protein
MIHDQEKIQIISNVKFCDALKSILHHLYQPIIGVQATALYSVLITEYSVMKEFNLDINHLRLTKLLQISLEQLNDARIKLEAMGLLKVYIDKNSPEVNYCYEILKPLDPDVFFNNLQFNELILTKLESYDYERTKFMFLPRTINLEK